MLHAAETRTTRQQQEDKVIQDAVVAFVLAEVEELEDLVEEDHQRGLLLLLVPAELLERRLP